MILWFFGLTPGFLWNCQTCLQRRGWCALCKCSSAVVLIFSYSVLMFWHVCNGTDVISNTFWHKKKASAPSSVFGHWANQFELFCHNLWHKSLALVEFKTVVVTNRLTCPLFWSAKYRGLVVYHFSHCTWLLWTCDNVVELMLKVNHTSLLHISAMITMVCWTWLLFLFHLLQLKVWVLRSTPCLLGVSHFWLYERKQFLHGQVSCCSNYMTEPIELWFPWKPLFSAKPL